MLKPDESYELVGARIVDFDFQVEVTFYGIDRETNEEFFKFYQLKKDSSISRGGAVRSLTQALP
jgi:hypothetical protein